jgi:hypothetical protein
VLELKHAVWHLLPFSFGQLPDRTRMKAKCEQIMQKHTGPFYMLFGRLW